MGYGMLGGNYMAATNTDLRGEGFNLNFWNDRRIKEIIELVKSDRELFLGIRHGSFNIYYKSMSILRVDSSFTGIIHSKYAKQYQPIYSLHKGIVRERATEVGNDDFTNGSKDEKYYAFNIDDQFIQAFIKAVKDKGLGLKSIIDKHVHNRGHGTIKKGYLEKIAQHNIIIKNNQDPASRWYCVDMEYCSPGLGFGRFDIIAISKEKNQDSRYDVALIELKYGDASYSDYGKQSNYHNAYIEALNLYDSAKKKRRYYCHIQDNEIYKVSFGSGIVGHCYNFSQFLFRNKGEAYTNLKKEICNILNLKINLDLLDNTSIDGIGSNSNSINIEDIAEKPLIYFFNCGM